MATPTETKKRPGFILIILAALFTFCVLCVVSSSVMNSLGLIPTSTPTLPPTETLPPTITNTPAPTDTPPPTATPLPTDTPTPTPSPIVLTGTGDSIVDFQKWDGPAIMHVRHVGGSNFVIRNYPATGTDPYDLMVNVIGSYEGTLPLDLFEEEQTARFEVKAGGQWEIQVLPFDMVRKEIVPGVIQGTGDEVFIIGGDPDLIKADASLGSSNFVVLAYSETNRDLVFNEIAPYTGTAILDPAVFLIVVKATGPWSLEITSK